MKDRSGERSCLKYFYRLEINSGLGNTRPTFPSQADPASNPHYNPGYAGVVLQVQELNKRRETTFTQTLVSGTVKESSRTQEGGEAIKGLK
ncbi:hypothetical protein Y1Q_0007389 [Alligator mississippiensis]|uniref:Uncharacterized protein n=1 Tax=Alligator mississippiensis TaxID=8496 RepID=A0A151P7T9_ALLMI|nr:hypothetical protein Y1Q_0007389 [Alligator mississippiensis]